MNHAYRYPTMPQARIRSLLLAAGVVALLAMGLGCPSILSSSFDFDLDGTTDRFDCAPEDPLIPGPEQCDNGIDDDCNGRVDQADDSCGPVLRPPESGTYSALVLMGLNTGSSGPMDVELSAYLTNANARRPDYWLPDLGECLQGLTVFTGPETTADHPIGTWLTIDGSGAVFHLEESEEESGYFSQRYADNGSVSYDTDYSVFGSFEQGDQLFPVWLPDGLSMPTRLSSIIPISLLSDEFLFSHVINLSAMNPFQWGVGSGEQETYLLIDFIPFGGAGYSSAVRCRVEDSGLAYIDGAVLSVLEPGSPLSVVLTRVLTREAVLPHDGSSALLIGSHAVWGTADLQP